MEDNFTNISYQENKITRYFYSLEPEEKRKAFKALDLAKAEHMEQFRHEGAIYYIHPIRVALAVAGELGITDIDMVCAALLHDVLEDGSVTAGHIESEFGPEVARIVKQVTRPKPDGETEEDKKANKIKKLEEIAQADEKVRLIKLCDVLDNMRSIQYIPEYSPARDKIPRWKEELQNHALPIAKKTNQILYNKLSAIAI